MKNNFVAKFMNRFNKVSVQEDNRQELLDRISLLEAKLEEKIESDKQDVVVFKRGDRVRVNETSGFNKGAEGVVEFVEPSGRTWVLREGSSGPVFFYPSELDLI